MSEASALEDLSALVQEARAGSREAFDRIVQPHVPMIRKFLHRLVCHPEDAEDLTQDTLLSGFVKLETFRGESSLSTWLIAIAARKGIDHLRARKRWPIEAQEIGEREFLASSARMASLDEVVRASEFRYEYRQHVAYCFSCVGRSLPPLESAALILTEVLLLENRDAARALGVSTSKLRHELTRGRESMEREFEGLCALISKTGVCHQCKSLRDVCPPERRGEEIAPLAAANEPAASKLQHRLRVVREAEIETGPAGDLHRLLFRYMSGLWDGVPPGAGRE
jgi:RNA polymerase sigma-70 factor, ECF subfamily